MSRNRLTAHDSRQSRRHRLPAMYTFVRVRPAGGGRYPWSGHIYDLSTGGMRFEVDAAIPDGTPVELCATLPGANAVTLRATGRIVRRHDDADEPGPVRLALAFEGMAPGHRHRLDEYLAGFERQAA